MIVAAALLAQQAEPASEASSPVVLVGFLVIILGLAAAGAWHFRRSDDGD